jgi:protein TonB
VDDPRAGSSPTLFAAALLLAGAAHLIVILGVSFDLPEAKPGQGTTRPLEVIVLRQAAPSDAKPEIADAFAQADRQGSGAEEVPETDLAPAVESAVNAPEPRPEPIPVEPLPPLAIPQPVPPPVPEPQPAGESGLTATLAPAPDTAEPAPAETPEPEPLTEPEPPEVVPEPEPEPPAVTAAEILASRGLEIAELRARIRHNSVVYANRARRKAISASTREYKYANYLEAWRRKVERIGNLNYPDEAKRRKMYGNLILHVAVRSDGSIERVRVLRSSGFDVLDDAAVKIVELAAPFAPFPPDIKAETDVLDITRTWQFLSNNRLGWGN